MKVTAAAPATTANLGPGFDCLGAALSIAVRVSAETDGSGGWSYRGPDPDGPGPDLVRLALEAAGADASTVDLSVDTDVPLERGLGSSAAAIAAGLLVGCALTGKAAEPAVLLELGLPLEGHPDNLAPALYGGVTVVVPGAPPGVLRLDPDPSVRPAIVVPDARLSTAEARKALPELVPLEHAVANVARASGLVALLTGQVEPTADHLLACTEDHLHQPHRMPLMPGTAELIRDLREAGVPAVVSGAGPAICCLVTADGGNPAGVVSGKEGWRLLELGWDARGAHVIDDGR